MSSLDIVLEPQLWAGCWTSVPLMGDNLGHISDLSQAHIETNCHPLSRTQKCKLRTWESHPQASWCEGGGDRSSATVVYLLTQSYSSDPHKRFKKNGVSCPHVLRWDRWPCRPSCRLLPHLCRPWCGWRPEGRLRLTHPHSLRHLSAT